MRSLGGRLDDADILGPAAYGYYGGKMELKVDPNVWMRLKNHREYNYTVTRTGTNSKTIVFSELFVVIVNIIIQRKLET